MRKNVLGWLFLLFLSPVLEAQEIYILSDGSECGMEGLAKRRNDKLFNRLKNRFAFPAKSDFDSTFNWQTLDEPLDDRLKFNARRAAILRGYVVKVDKSSPETCNCKSKGDDDKDTHVVIVSDLTYLNDKSKHVVAEVTPRMRRIMKKSGIDWSQKSLKALKGKHIEIEGWLFYDANHDERSNKIKPNTDKVNRATAWEIHPITSIKILTL